MFKKYLTITAMTLSLAQMSSCSKSPLTTGSINSDMMSGVAATGAPISGGKIEIKGSDGEIVEVTTNSDGSYEADIGELTEPFLIRVISPSGEKFISVASKEALEEGKKINVTPLTHIIVANVFEIADPDQIFTSFEAEAGNYSDAKLEEQKDALHQKLVDAGLIGAGKIAGNDIDLLNGELRAGTSEGIDGLLDVVDVNVQASAGIEIKLKGDSTPIITDKVDDVDPPAVVIDNSQLNASKAKLTVLEQIRTQLNGLAALYSSKVACNGAPVDNDSACDVDNLYSQFSPFFHADYQENGHAGEAGVWGFICESDGGSADVYSKVQCLASGEFNFKTVMLKDVSLINYDSVNNLAFVNFNIYMNGALRGSEEMMMKLDGAAGLFKLAGNKKTFDYWIEAESIFRTVYMKARPEVDQLQSVENRYNVNLNMYFKDSGAHSFDGDETFTLTAQSGHNMFPGNSESMQVYLVVGPNHNSGSCESGLVFSTRPDPYRIMNQADGTVTYANFATACSASNDPCNCSDGTTIAWYDYETAQKITLSAAQVATMDKSERITLSGAGVNEEFILKKPLVINAFNAGEYVPTFGQSATEYCSNPSATSALNLAVLKGELNYISLWVGFSNEDNSSWSSDNAGEELAGSQALFTPVFSNLNDTNLVQYKGMYLSSRDEHDRRFVREVNCQ